MDSFSLQEEQLMHRFFFDSGRSTEEAILLSEEDARHAATVLRLKSGQHIELIGNGQRYEAEIVSADRRDFRVRTVRLLSSTEPVLSVTLFQGLPKGDKMDMIIQKATELGVFRVVPVIMNRCVARLEQSDFSRRLDRWNRIAREAAKQSGRCLVPEVLPPVLLRNLPDTDGFPGINIVPWENTEGYGPLAFRNDHPSLLSLGILIGPEGGIEEEEIAFLRHAGFVCITLGKRILRTETAGLASVSAFMSLYGEME